MVAMTLIVVTLVVAVVAGWARGGRVRHLALVRLRHPWFVALALAAQLATAAVGAVAGGVGALLPGSSLLAVSAFLAANRRLPGVPLVATGFALNAAVILANGAMPVSPSALRRAGGTAGPLTPGRHRLLAPGDRLPLLADVIPVPLLGIVVSAGDVLLAAGVALLVTTLMRAPTPAMVREG